MDDEHQRALAIVEDWVRDFHHYGDWPDCILIVHEGYAEDDDEKPILQEPVYSVYINSKSDVIDMFPPLETAFGLVVHSADNFWITACLMEETDFVHINVPEAEEGYLSWPEAAQIILAIEEKRNS